MKIDIRESIKENFKGSSKEEIKESIHSALEEKEEITLPGFGVFFEILWEGSSENEQEFILNTIQKEFEKSSK